MSDIMMNAVTTPPQRPDFTVDEVNKPSGMPSLRRPTSSCDSAVVDVAGRCEQGPVVLLVEGQDQLVVRRVQNVALLEDKVPFAGVTIVMCRVHEDAVEALERDLSNNALVRTFTRKVQAAVLCILLDTIRKCTLLQSVKPRC